MRFLLFLFLLLVPFATFCNGLYNHKTSRIIELKSSNFKKLVIDSNETWMVEFYAPWCGHCKNLAPHWDKAASKLDGIVHLGAVNCDEDKELPQKYGVKGFPTIKVFKGTGKKARKPSDYNGERTSKAIVDFAKSSMPNFAAKVKDSGLDAFFTDEAALHHVLLFSDKKVASPSFKALSAKFLGKISMGYIVDGSDSKNAKKKFNVQTLPTLIAFPPGKSDPQDAIVLKQDINGKAVEKFLTGLIQGTNPDDLMAESNSAATGDAEDSEQDADALLQPEVDPSKKKFDQPTARHGVEIAANSKDFRLKCSHRADTGVICLAAMLKNLKENALYKELEALHEKYKYDNLVFVALDAEKSISLADALGLDSNKDNVFVFRPNKNKYSILETDEQIEGQHVDDFLGRVRSFEITYKKLKEADDLPDWGVVEEAAKKATEDIPQEESGHDDEGSCGLEPPEDGKTCSS